jgi:hypothetical protein
VAVAELPELARLDAAEQRELVLLVKEASTPPCVRCGRPGHDIARLTDVVLPESLSSFWAERGG